MPALTLADAWPRLRRASEAPHRPWPAARCCSRRCSPRLPRCCCQQCSYTAQHLRMPCLRSCKRHPRSNQQPAAQNRRGMFLPGDMSCSYGAASMRSLMWHRHSAWPHDSVCADARRSPTRAATSHACSHARERIGVTHNPVGSSRHDAWNRTRCRGGASWCSTTSTPSTTGSGSCRTSSRSWSSVACTFTWPPATPPSPGARSRRCVQGNAPCSGEVMGMVGPHVWVPSTGASSGQQAKEWVILSGLAVIQLQTLSPRS